MKEHMKIHLVALNKELNKKIELIYPKKFNIEIDI